MLAALLRLRLLLLLLLLVAPLSQAYLAPQRLQRQPLALWGDVLVTNQDTKQTTTLPAGSPVSLGCVRTGLRLSYQCKKGDCASCEFLLDGKVVRACITKIPDKRSVTVKAKPLLNRRSSLSARE